MRLSGPGNLIAPVLTALILLVSNIDASAEDWNEAWSIALRVNEKLIGQQEDTRAAAHNIEAARAARRPAIKNQTFNALISPTPGTAGSIPTGATGGSGTGRAASLSGGLFGNQPDIPISNTAVSVPLYSGGRLKHNVHAAEAQLGAQRAEEFRTVLDLKLTVAESFVGVLRRQKELSVAESNIARLSAFLQDVLNRKNVGMATLNDELAAKVSLANARQDQIKAQRNLSAAWATYNRYLGRPLTFTTELTDISVAPASGEIDDLTSMSLRSKPELAASSEAEIQSLTSRALQTRPELANLSEQARSFREQAEANKSGLRPSISINAGHTYLGFGSFQQHNFLTSVLTVNWTLADFGATRRKTDALNAQARALLHRRADAAADIALDVRNAWLDLAEARRRIPVTQEAINQAEENVKVLTDRYKEGLSNYTQVLDAETLRVQTLNNYYAAVYDAVLAAFRLERAAGSI